jgi:hypothetical protein
MRLSNKKPSFIFNQVIKTDLISRNLRGFWIESAAVLISLLPHGVDNVKAYRYHLRRHVFAHAAMIKAACLTFFRFVIVFDCWQNE